MASIFHQISLLITANKQTNKWNRKHFNLPKGLKRGRTLSQLKTGVHLLWGYGLKFFFSRLIQNIPRGTWVFYFSRWSRWSSALHGHLAGNKKPLRKKGRCNLYVYKCQNVKACNPFKRWWGLWLKLGTSPDFNTRKVLTPSSGGEHWVLISLSPSLTLRYTYSPSLPLALEGLFWCQCIWIYSRSVQYTHSGMFCTLKQVFKKMNWDWGRLC